MLQMTEMKVMQAVQSANTQKLISDYIKMLATKLEQINTVMQIESNINLTLPNNALRQKEQLEKINDLKV